MGDGAPVGSLRGEQDDGGLVNLCGVFLKGLEYRRDLSGMDGPHPLKAQLPRLQCISMSLADIGVVHSGVVNRKPSRRMGRRGNFQFCSSHQWVVKLAWAAHG